MGRVRPPAPRPCGSCPYRRDVPSGVWDEEEYAKLPAYDEPETGRQPPGVFLCHQQDGCLCAGWVAVHDMAESLGLRMAVIAGVVSASDVDEILDYGTDVALWPSGAEAAAHGLQEVTTPGVEAVRAIQKLERRRGR